MEPKTSCRCAICAAGEDAREIDLTGVDDPARTVPADCVRRAIMRPSGLQLVKAKFDGSLALDYQTVNGPLCLRNCDFVGVSANNTTFENVVEFSGSTLTGDLDFIGATFQRVLLLQGVKGKNICLWSARLLSGVSAIPLPSKGDPDEETPLTLSGDLDARELSVAASADFTGAVITGKTWFRRAHVGQTLSLNGASCSGEVILNGATITDIDLSGATCTGGVQLRGVHVAETLRLHSGSFERAISFDECEVRDLEIGPSAEGLAASPQLVGPTFSDGEVTFLGGSVTTLMRIAKAKFARAVRFDGFHMVGVNVAGTVFEGKLTLADVRIERSANVEHCTFGADFVAQNLEIAGTAKFTDIRCDEHDLVMTGAKFGSDLRFRDVRCRHLDLSGATVAARLLFEGQQARIGPDGDETLKLENVNVAQDMTLDVQVEGSVKLRGLNVQGSLAFAAGFKVGAVQAPFLSVGRDLTFSEQARVTGALDLTGAKVTGTLTFSTGPDPLPESIMLNSATLGTLSFKGPKPPPFVVDMVGCTYDTFSSDQLWLIDYIKKAQLPIGVPLAWLYRLFRRPARREVPDRQPFLRLEKVLRNAGDDGLANRVFYKGRMRTRWKSRAIQWVPQFLFSGFGVRPWLLLLWIGILWLGATVFFSFANGSVRDLSLQARTEAARRIDPKAKAPQSVEERQHSCGDDRLNPFRGGLLSLELFLPSTLPNTDFVAAPSCPVTIGPWKLGPWITAAILFLLKLGGLILIPLAVVTISGVLRPSPRG